MSNLDSSAVIYPTSIESQRATVQPPTRHPRPSLERDGRATRTILSTRGLTKSYRKGPVTIPVLRGVNFQAGEGQFTSIVGQSGSGKSTLLHLMATLDIPDEGEILYDGQRIDNLAAYGRDVLRNCHIGMIFQFYHLLPELSTLENVLLPSMITDSPWRYWLEEAKAP